MAIEHNAEQVTHELNELTERWRETRLQLTVLNADLRELKARLDGAAKAEFELWTHLTELRQTLQAIDEDRPMIERPGISRMNGPAKGMINPQARWEKGADHE